MPTGMSLPSFTSAAIRGPAAYRRRTSKWSRRALGVCWEHARVPDSARRSDESAYVSRSRALRGRAPGLPVDAPGQATPLVFAHGRVEQPIRVHAVLPAPVYDEIELSITIEVAGPADLEVRREDLM
jgi:hypothetical protein